MSAPKYEPVASFGCAKIGCVTIDPPGIRLTRPAEFKMPSNALD